MKFPTYKNEQEKIASGYSKVAGCDEVGIAPLAGPVVAASVILDPKSIGKQRSKHKWWYRVRDSKTVDEQERGELVNFIYDHCQDFAIGVVSHETIDEINIHQAGLLAMQKSIEGLRHKPDYIFLDGINRIKSIDVPQDPVIGGDVKILSIAAASIVAKVARDGILSRLHEQFPAYGFIRHKGYGTKFHRLAILKHGVCPVHRKSFALVEQSLKKFRSFRFFEKHFLHGEVA